jgi:hypothetical protein
MVMLLGHFGLMRYMACRKTLAFCVCLNKSQDSFFQCVYFFTVVIARVESSTLLEVKLGSYRRTIGHHSAVREVAACGGVCC